MITSGIFLISFMQTSQEQNHQDIDDFLLAGLQGKYSRLRQHEYLYWKLEGEGFAVKEEAPARYSVIGNCMICQMISVNRLMWLNSSRNCLIG